MFNVSTSFEYRIEIKITKKIAWTNFLGASSKRSQNYYAKNVKKVQWPINFVTWIFPSGEDLLHCICGMEKYRMFHEIFKSSTWIKLRHQTFW